MLDSSFPYIAFNTAAALFILARYLYRGLTDPDQKKWAQALAVPGGVAIVLGSPVIRGWLLKGMAGSALDIMSMLLGLFFIGLAVAIWRGLNLLPLGTYAAFAGLMELIVGLKFLGSQMWHNLHVATMHGMAGLEVLVIPALAIALITTGLGCFAALYMLRSHRNQIVGTALFVLSAIFWLIAGLTVLIGVLWAQAPSGLFL
ncbi:MAG: DUF981 family protein [Armatimonadetes bacterium]|nr:DUF981 family protein [Armatimonadota bacterium]